MQSSLCKSILFALTLLANGLRAEVAEVSLEDMAASHVARLARRNGILPCTRDAAVTNFFGHIRFVGPANLTPGSYALQIRDADGWLEVRDDNGNLVCQVAPTNEHPTDWLWLLFSVDEEDRTKNYWRLSYLVSIWDVVDEDYEEPQGSGALRAPRRLVSTTSLTNAEFSAISVTDHTISYVARWPPSFHPIDDILDLYACADLSKQEWRRVDAFQTSGIICHTGTVSSASVPGWDAGLRLVHDPDCYATTNVVSVPFGLAGTFTNVVWSCDHHAISAKPVFLRFSDRSDTDNDGIPDCLRIWGAGRDSDSDGLPDWVETWYGLNPFSVNSDGDVLDDSAEVGKVELLEGEDFLWFDIGDRPNRLRGTSDRNSAFLWDDLASPFVWRGREYPSVDWYLDGLLHLLPDADWQVLEESFCNPALGVVFGRDSLADGCVTVAGCNDDMYARTQDWNSGMYNWSIVTNGVTYDIFAWRNIGLASQSSVESPLLTYEVIFSSAESGVVYVSYLDVGDGISTRNMSLGVQSSGTASPLCTNEHYTLRWPTHLVRPASRTTVRYTLGTATDPRVSDTDGDGIPDGFVAANDFDADADGLVDWIDAAPTVSDGACHGQSDDWVRASFTNAEEILAVGYTNWVAATVGVCEPNGRFALTVSVTNAPSQEMLVRVGEYAVVADRCCDLVFPLEVFETYSLEIRNADAPLVFACDDGFPTMLGTSLLSVSLSEAGARLASASSGGGDSTGSLSVTPVLVAEPASVPIDAAAGTTLRAFWNVPAATYSWRDDLNEVELSNPRASETDIQSAPSETMVSVVASDASNVHSATGMVAIVGNPGQPSQSLRVPASLGWTTGVSEENSVLRPDTMRIKWATLVGGERQGASNSRTFQVSVPAGRTVYAGVFLASTEYPTWTSARSQFNDYLYWRISAPGLSGSACRGDARVNAWHDRLAASSHLVRGADHAVFAGGTFISAPTNEALTVTVTLGANNVGDGQRESGVSVGFFPVTVFQTNYPQVTGALGTSDADLARTNALVQNCGVAYITSEPAPPALTSRIRGLPNWLPTRWRGEITSEREAYRPNNIDTRILLTNLVFGADTYDVTAAFTNEVIGGNLKLFAQVSNTVEHTIPLCIRGKNPMDNVASNYIDAVVDADFRSFAWMIAKHESKSGSRFYNQFNPGVGLKEKPFKGNDTVYSSGNVVTNYGWGMCQIDRDMTGLGARSLYDWHRNVADMNEKLIGSQETYDRFLGYFRETYQGDLRWREPDGVVTNLNGQVVSLKTWSILTFYNGANGCPGIYLNGRRRYCPFEFNPTATNWIFHLNSKRYPIGVLGDRLLEEDE